MFDYWGEEIPRYYRLETLANAVEHHLRTRDRFIIPSVNAVMGPVPLVSMRFKLFQEGAVQLIFQLQAVNAKKNRTSLAFVVAKNATELSKTAHQEHQNLRALHVRRPEDVVEPLQGGKIFLPDRHGRKTHGREIYAYLTRWLGGYHELGVNKNLQFFINALPPHTFTRDQTEALKQRIVEIVVASYDPNQKTAMAIPQVASGDFVVTRTKSGVPRIKLIACRTLQKRVTPPRLIDRLVRAEWAWGEKTFRLVPVDPADFIAALQAALGKEETKRWLAAYERAVKVGAVKKHPYLEPALNLS